MYIHIGNDVVVPLKSVVGIFDLDNSSLSHITREFLNGAEKAGKVGSAGDELPKSFVLCADKGGYRVYLSQLSSATLLKRSAGQSFE